MNPDELAAWSAWTPIDEAASQATTTPGVYMARTGPSGTIVYVGMAGLRSGKGVRGRLSVYARGVAIHSGLGQAAFDRALADVEFVRRRLADLEAGRAIRARDWGRAAIERADLYVRWATCATPEEARDLERRVIAASDPAGLWNR